MAIFLIVVVLMLGLSSVPLGLSLFWGKKVSFWVKIVKLFEGGGLALICPGLFFGCLSNSLISQ